MRTFEKKPKAAQQTPSTKSPNLSRSFVGQSRDIHSILHRQRTIGNQAVQRLLCVNSDGREDRTLTIGSPCFAHDFSRIPVHASGNACIKSKLRINVPGDKYEQEADRVADHVMRMHEEQLQHACPCGGGCPRCQTQQPGRGKESRKTGHLLDSSAEGSMVQTLVNDVLYSPGQPLDVPTRTFMERRLGHDFSQVRVHSDAKAVAAAQAIQARAFTFGRDIVFGAQEYRSGATRGKHLLAHEFAHVVQQTQSEPVVQREVGDNTGQQQPTEFEFNVTPQIRWALIALLIRPVAEEDTWACLAGRGEYDKPRILHNYFIRYRGNSSLDQIHAQQPANVDRDRYIQSVMEFLWSSIREDFMRMAAERMSRNAEFRRRVGEAATGRGCSTVPYIPPGSGAAAV